MRTRQLLPACIASFTAILLPMAMSGQTAVVDDDLEVEVFLSCPPDGDANSTITVDLRFENFECKAINTRILSSIVGNGDQTLGGMRIFGPVVLQAMPVLPAATGTILRGCVQGTCQNFFGPPISCETDADCPDCEGTDPGVVELSIPAPPALPADLQGTVGTHIIVAELEAGPAESVETNQCFVEVK